MFLAEQNKSPEPASFVSRDIGHGAPQRRIFALGKEGSHGVERRRKERPPGFILVFGEEDKYLGEDVHRNEEGGEGYEGNEVTACCVILRICDVFATG